MAAVRTVEPVASDLFRPWRRPGELWWGLVHIMTGLVVGSVVGILAWSLVAVTAVLLITFPLALPFAWLLFVVVLRSGRFERTRFAALLDVEIDDPIPPLEAGSWWGRLKERASSRPRRRELVYVLLRFPLGVLGAFILYQVWAGSVALIFLPLYVRHLPGGSAKFGLFEVGHPALTSSGLAATAAALVGVIGVVLVAPWSTRGLVRLDVAVARRLLGRPRTDELGERVAHLEASRSAAVDGAEAERRRIERDLHDGAQQRLVAMAVNLGAAREKLDDDPTAGRRLVAEAHDEAKEALKELRDLVRGIHPVILEDRGLDAALSSVVARLPLPVNLEVDVAERPAAAIESAAYFVVAEALTNVARHAEASAVQVTIVRAGPRLVVEVRDNGVGGADPAQGSGLAGLENRVEALDGRLDLISPAGGPTTLLVELPCES